MKLLLVCWKVQKPLYLGFYEAYVNNTNILPLLEIEYENLIDTSSTQLASSICAANMFE